MKLVCRQICIWTCLFKVSAKQIKDRDAASPKTYLLNVPGHYLRKYGMCLSFRNLQTVGHFISFKITSYLEAYCRDAIDSRDVPDFCFQRETENYDCSFLDS